MVYLIVNIILDERIYKIVGTKNPDYFLPNYLVVSKKQIIFA